MPRLSLAPMFTPPDGGRAPVGLFVGGLLVPGVKQLLANEGGDVLLVLDRALVDVDPRVQRAGPDVVPSRLRLATDGEA